APGRRRVRRAEQALVVPLDRLGQRVGQPAAALAPLALTRGRVAQRDAGAPGQVLDRAGEVDLLDVLDERDGVARPLAAEAVEEALLTVDGERRRLLAMERAEADPATPHLAQLQVAGDDGDEVGGGLDGGDVVVV